MSGAALVRFQQAYWGAFRELDSLRLRLWEQSHVTLPQIRVLFQIRRRPEITTSELSRALGITVSTASGLVIKLADRGLIERLTVAEDRRQAPLRLTDGGVALLGELSETTRSFVGEVAGLLGSDLEAVTNALERLGDAAARARPSDLADEPAAAATGTRQEPR
jgi:DNA-binding MarR family transcriptional regulator